MKIIELCAIDQTMRVLLTGLNKRLMGKKYEVICVCSKGPFTEELRNEGFNVINIPIERKINLLPCLKSIYKLYKLFKTERPDIIHVHTPIASVLGRIAAKAARVPIVIYTAHGFYFHENMPFIKYNVYLNIEKYMARFFTDFIFTQSEEDRNTAVKNKFIDENKIFNIGNGVDVCSKFNPDNISFEEVNRLYEELNISRENKIVTFIGRFVEEKGILDLLEGFSGVKDPKVNLLVVGDIDQGSRDENTKGKIINTYKDNNSIVFTGFRRDINNILYITDIFCLPSYREGMPRTIIEAMAMECAVIATNIRGCREEVTDGGNGFLIKLSSPEEIKNKIELLISNESLLNKMKLEGRKRAVDCFNETECIEKQINIIERLFSQLNVKR